MRTKITYVERNVGIYDTEVRIAQRENMYFLLP
jgi:hypothetical protein